MFRADSDLSIVLILFVVGLIVQGLKFFFRKIRETGMANVPPAAPHVPRPSRPAAEKKPCPEEPKPVIRAGKTAPPLPDAPEEEPFDYARFLRKHGREAVVLSEIVLPPDSRASWED